MKRNALSSIALWNTTDTPKPLFITGTRGVGKTYLALDFATSFYENHIYINPETDSYARKMLMSCENPILAIAAYVEIPQELLPKILIVIDEIQAVSGLSEKLCHCLEKDNMHYHIILISSIAPPTKLLSKLSLLKVFPMQFDEFLTAFEREWYIEVIRAHFTEMKKIPGIVHEELLSLFEEYLSVGGMPAAVSEYIEMKSYDNVAEWHRICKLLTRDDIQTYCAEEERYKCLQVFDTIEEQLLKQNEKFRFNLIRKGITYQMYKNAIDYLINNNHVIRINDIRHDNRFKLYYPDCAMYQTISKESNISFEKKRMEQYIILTLMEKGKKCFFWESDSQAKINILLEENDKYTPVEYIESGFGKTRSIHSFAAEYPISNILLLSNQNFECISKNQYNVPKYSLFCM